MNDGKRLLDALLSLSSESLAPIAALLHLNVLNLASSAVAGVMNSDPDKYVASLLSERISAYQRETDLHLVQLLLGRLASSLQTALPSIDSSADLDYLAAVILEAAATSVRDSDHDFDAKGLDGLVQYEHRGIGRPPPGLHHYTQTELFDAFNRLVRMLPEEHQFLFRPQLKPLDLLSALTNPFGTAVNAARTTADVRRFLLKRVPSFAIVQIVSAATCTAAPPLTGRRAALLTQFRSIHGDYRALADTVTAANALEDERSLQLEGATSSVSEQKARLKELESRHAEDLVAFIQVSLPYAQQLKRGISTTHASSTSLTLAAALDHLRTVRATQPSGFFDRLTHSAKITEAEQAANRLSAEFAAKATQDPKAAAELPLIFVIRAFGSTRALRRSSNGGRT